MTNVDGSEKVGLTFGAGWYKADVSIGAVDLYIETQNVLHLWSASWSWKIREDSQNVKKKEEVTKQF